MQIYDKKTEVNSHAITSSGKQVRKNKTNYTNSSDGFNTFPQKNNHLSNSNDNNQSSLNYSDVKTSNKLKQLKEGYKFNIGKEQHRLYFDKYNGQMELMMASTPRPFWYFIRDVMQDKNDNNNVKEMIDKFIEANQILQNKSYTQEAVNRLQNFLDYMLDWISIGYLHSQNISFDINKDEIKPHENEPQFDESFNYLNTPDEHTIVPLGMMKFEAADGFIYENNNGVAVNYLSAKGKPGSIINDNLPNESGYYLIDKLGQKDIRDNGQKQHYTKGHLLNHLLHGPGDKWWNLVVIPRATNLATAEDKELEDYAKKKIIENNQVLYYRVQASYDPAWEEDGFYESMLPLELHYTINIMQPLPKKDDYTRQENWVNSRIIKTKAYECKIPYDDREKYPIKNGPKDPACKNNFKSIIIQALEICNSTKSTKIPNIFKEFPLGCKNFANIHDEIADNDTLTKQEVKANEYMKKAEEVIMTAKNFPDLGILRGDNNNFSEEAKYITSTTNTNVDTSKVSIQDNNNNNNYSGAPYNSNFTDETKFPVQQPDVGNNTKKRSINAVFEHEQQSEEIPIIKSRSSMLGYAINVENYYDINSNNLFHTSKDKLTWLLKLLIENNDYINFHKEFVQYIEELEEMKEKRLDYNRLNQIWNRLKTFKKFK